MKTDVELHPPGLECYVSYSITDIGSSVHCQYHMHNVLHISFDYNDFWVFVGDTSSARSQRHVVTLSTRWMEFNYCFHNSRADAHKPKTGVAVIRSPQQPYLRLAFVYCVLFSSFFCY
jgi:hypothetical protein